MPEPAPASEDPTTIIGLIFRVLDRPHRTLCLLAVLALVLAGAAQLLHAPDLAGLPVGIWGAGLSAGTVTGAVIKRRHKERRGSVITDVN